MIVNRFTDRMYVDVPANGDSDMLMLLKIGGIFEKFFFFFFFLKYFKKF